MTTSIPCIVTAGPVVLAHAVDTRGRYHPESLSGAGIFAAVGARLWSDEIHLLGRTGSDFPQTGIQAIENQGVRTDSLKPVENTCTPRIYYRASRKGVRFYPNAAGFFRSIDQPIPKYLLQIPESMQKHPSHGSLPDLAPRPRDIPAHLPTPSGVLITGSYQSQLAISAHLQQNAKSIVVLSPPARILEPDCSEELRLLLAGISCVILKREDLPGSGVKDTELLLSYAEKLCDKGCSSVVFTRGNSGELGWDHAARTAHHVPAYPSTVLDPVGAHAGFCGGFLAGFTHTGDLQESMLQGTVSASLIVEGTPAFHALEALPGLARARADFLRDRIRKVQH